MQSILLIACMQYECNFDFTCLALQHTMLEASGYCWKLYHGHLEKAPKYKLPPLSKHPPGPVSQLKPSIEGVELRHHGSETAVALEGKNLWFCYQLSVGGHSEKTPPQDLSGTSIQFNIPKGKSSTTDGGSVRVTTHSHFTKPVKQEVVVSEKKVSQFILVPCMKNLDLPVRIWTVYLTMECVYSSVVGQPRSDNARCFIHS